jgi:hypothetical protein
MLLDVVRHIAKPGEPGSAFAYSLLPCPERRSSPPTHSNLGCLDLLVACCPPAVPRPNWTGDRFSLLSLCRRIMGSPPSVSGPVAGILWV